MRTLLILKNIETKKITHLYYKNKEEALEEWDRWPHNLDWKILCMRDGEKSGHRYELEYAKFDDCGELYSRYIICSSKQEALHLKNKIREFNPDYLFNIKKLY